jgi:hypothetical protein
MRHCTLKELQAEIDLGFFKWIRLNAKKNGAVVPSEKIIQQVSYH